MNCPHITTKPVPCDQTIGIQCVKCNSLVAACWMDDHIPELLWNRACSTPNDLGAIPTEHSREDHCAICKEAIK